MTLSEYRQMVEADLKIDETELDSESLRTPQLHSKYLNFLTDEKLKASKLEYDYNRLKKYKWLYYIGKLSEEELADFGWEPFQLSILKTDIDRFLNADEELQLISNKLEYQKSVIYYLENIIKVISNRQWNIRSAIDWIKFTNGQ